MVTPGPAHPLWAPSVSVFSPQHPPRWFVLYAQGLPQLSSLSFWIRKLLLQSLASLQNHKIGPDDASSVWELGFSLKASLFWWCSLPDYYIVIFFTGILKSTPLAILLRMPTQWCPQVVYQYCWVLYHQELPSGQHPLELWWWTVLCVHIRLWCFCSLPLRLCVPGQSWDQRGKYLKKIPWENTSMTGCF